MSVDKTLSLALIGPGKMGRALTMAMNRSLAEIDLSLVVTEYGRNDDVSKSTNADVILLAVKPNVLADVLPKLVDSKALIITAIAGKLMLEYESVLGESTHIIRIMPNTPIIAGQGVTGYFMNAACNDHDEQTLNGLLRKSGYLLRVNQESDIDVITAISGSGPAYYYAFTEALTKAGVELGLPLEAADCLARQTAAGASTMMANSDEAVSILRENVTSKGGTTAAALAAFEQGGLSNIVNSAVQACFKRAKEL